MTEKKYEPTNEDIEDVTMVKEGVVELRCSTDCVNDICSWKKNILYKGDEKAYDFTLCHPIMTKKEAELESSRCLRCFNAPCETSCPIGIPVNRFIHAISCGNPFGAAEALYNRNPLSMSCGFVCTTSIQCTGSCNLSKTSQGPIKIKDLQVFACNQLMKMNIPQIVSPEIQKLAKGKPFDTKIAFVGAGPASLSCASFLARLGYKDLTILERNSKAGGVISYEVPQFRLPYHCTKFDVKMVKDLGVKFEFNKSLGEDYTFKSLKEEEGYEVVFAGVGKAVPYIHPIFKDAPKEVTNSQTFLRSLAYGSKKGLNGKKQLSPLPELDGHVVVIGAGDSAIDCALGAFRCGAKRVTIVLRRGINDMRCAEEEFELARSERCELIGFSLPKRIIVENDKLKALEVVTTLKGWDGNYVPDEKQIRQIPCDHLITAFGYRVEKQPLSELDIDKNNLIKINNKTGQTETFDWVFAGGDCIGSSTVVAAANDGKVAAAGIHKMLLAKNKIENIPKSVEFPPFTTPVSDVDISTEFAGLRFENPFGLASGPGTENYGMLKRAFQMGWGWAVTKTCSYDEDFIPNVTPRIANCSGKNSYLNIELNADRSYKYWLKAIKRLKQEFPKKVVIASIHCKQGTDVWVKLAKEFIAAGPDGLQLNFACPNLNAGKSSEKEQENFKSYGDQVGKVVKAIREFSDIPLFPKLPFQIPHGELEDVVMEALNNGATGVSAINSFSGLASVHTDSKPFPNVSDKYQSAYGGISGTQIKSIAMKAVSMIKKTAPDLYVLGCGGMKDAKTAIEMIHLGSSVVQLCSAVMTYGYPIIYELCSGLKYHLYSSAREDLSKWEGQFFVPSIENKTSFNIEPKMGKWLINQRKEKMESLSRENLLIVDESEYYENTKEIVVKEVPKLHEIVGQTLKYLIGFGDLSKEEKLYSKIDLDSCVRCLRCYQSCHDSAAQAIDFDPETNTPRINLNKCIGCMLCVSVCPTECIQLVKEKY
ncbi:dihydropyrimidine dehydrogenase [NADP(+)] [Anaeramoeba flamelloides]|uniref:dihydropyrimidine dehydrogenase (NADP(+)) n=1 Tax=Anaeramoeba flamelloides TaxID=1746091 RepID=A0ABQ8YJT8_9EUKA|nr:dihydropyrimidine dehydrogenase [NADP(+)] [Anaeramoeba flamelloides]